MSKLSNNNGRAFEFITLRTFESELNNQCLVSIDQTGGYSAANLAWESTSKEMQDSLSKSAKVAVEIVLELEPLILTGGDGVVELSIQTDQAGKDGDVRDIIIKRPGIMWIIGLSLKHNHKAVKHSRLSASIDFGKQWYNIPCSKTYWDEVKPVFDRLVDETKNNRLWREIPDKDSSVYVPILDAFIKEVKSSSQIHPSKVSKNMTMYLLGIHDFYKIMTKDSKRLVNVKAFNLNGTLGVSSVGGKSTKVCILPLPRRIVHIGMKPRSNTTVELCLDEGWSFSFRIHSAETKVVPSLKFDVNLIGHPSTMLSIIRQWT